MIRSIPHSSLVSVHLNYMVGPSRVPPTLFLPIVLDDFSTIFYKYRDGGGDSFIDFKTNSFFLYVKIKIFRGLVKLSRRDWGRRWERYNF